MFFRGRFQHSMDDKGRVSIPLRFREMLKERRDSRLVITNMTNCLVVYPHEEWILVEEKVAGLPSVRPDVRSFQRFFISAATECVPDKQGRILIPPTLREHAALEKDVLVVGMQSNFELWAKAKWDDEIRRGQENFDVIASSLAPLVP
ncbi:MAG: division/cell wall cluster transcriptional repressor MraZ [Pseudomonadota bacterium]